MKKKIVILLLLILAGMGIFLSQNGWCALAPWARHEHTPWEPALLSPGPGGDTNNLNDTNIDIENSPFIDIYILEIESLLRRGDKNSNIFQQKQGNSGQVK